VRAAAAAEAAFGAARGLGWFVYVTVGTGISSCLVQHGGPLPGARGNALVLASALERSRCVRCGAENEITLEALASGPGLVHEYDQVRTGAATRAEDVLAAAAAGDADAVRVVSRACETLGARLGWLANVLDPEAIVLGGGLGLGLVRAFLAPLAAAARSAIWAPDSRSIPIVAAALGTDAGIVGAALGAARQVKMLSTSNQDEGRVG
jgi:glucokinase